MTHGVRSSLLAGLALALMGCVSVRAEPALPFPERPDLTFRCTSGYCCLTESETNELNRWVKKLNEFEAARARLLKD